MYMDDWEVAAKNGGFLSKSTAEGLRVTLESTKSLLEYLTGLGYKYLMTARLSQDCIERLFGIIRQSCGGNDHPTPSQFLIVVNCLSFYNLARSPAGGTISKGVLNALLSSQDTVTSARADSDEISNQGSQGNAKEDMQDCVTRARADLDELVDQGKLGDAEKALAHDHIPCFKEKSDSRLTFYIAGYAARKCVKTQHCSECKELCIRDSAPVETDHPASFTKQFDRGGLVYVTDALFVLISRLESIFTSCFSKGAFRTDSVLDLMACVQGNTSTVGCEKHKVELTAVVTKFYLITRLHFYVKELNKLREQKRIKQRLAKQGKLL